MTELPPPAWTAPTERRRIRWLHVLVLLTTLGSGAGAGEILCEVLDLEHYARTRDCYLARGGVWPPALTVDGDLARAYRECARPANLIEGGAKLAGVAAAVLLLAVVLVVSGLRARRRVIEAGSGPYAVIAARFDYWCAELRLPRPRLVVPAFGGRTRRAHTTGLPLGRPTVVVPESYAVAGRTQLDLALLHELAHVRSRDVTWASATWWSGWLTPALPASALLVGLTRPYPVVHNYGRALLSAVVLSAAALVLRTVVLRRRETSADHFAVARGGCLCALRDQWGPPVPLRRRLLASHPPARTRAAARFTSGWDSGFGVAAAVSLLAMSTAQAVGSLADLFLAPAGWSGGDVGRAVAALAWSATLVPIWARTRAAWWGRATGATAGLLAGLYLQSAGTGAGSAVVWFPGHVAASAAVLAAVLAGVVAVTLAFAGAARGRPAVVAAALGGALVLTLFLSVPTVVMASAWEQVNSAASAREMVVDAGHVVWAKWVPPALTVLAAVVLGARRPSRASLLTCFGVAAAVSAVGLLVTHRRMPFVNDADSAVFLLYQVQWMCAAAGLVAGFAVLIARREPLAALLGGAVTALLVAVAQGAGDWIGHLVVDPRGIATSFVATGPWLFLVAAVLTAPVAGLILARPPTIRRRGVPIAVAPPVAAGLAPPVAAGLAPPVAAGLAVVIGAGLAVVIGAGTLAPVTGGPHDYSAMMKVMADPAVLTTLTARPGADPGRPLDQATLDAALNRLRANLTGQWHVADDLGDGAPPIRPRRCADLFAARDRLDDPGGRLARGRLTLRTPADSSLALIVRITSYRTPATARGYLNAVLAAARACPRYTIGPSLAVAQTATRDPSGITVRSTARQTVKGLPLTVDTVERSALIGNTLVYVDALGAAPSRPALAPRESDRLERTARSAVASATAACG